MTIWTSSRRSQHSAPRRCSASPACRPSGRRQRGSGCWPRRCSGPCSATRRSPSDLQIAVRYQPAAEEAQVGGDWYDAFVVRDGCTLLAIGDVAGHDQDAAAAMGQVRNLLRGIAYSTDEPTRGGAPRARRRDARARRPRCSPPPCWPGWSRLGRMDDDGAPTLLLRWSNAGHPPPLLINARRDRGAPRPRAGAAAGAGTDDPSRCDHTHVVRARCHGAALHRRTGRASRAPPWRTGSAGWSGSRRGSAVYRSRSSATSCSARSWARPRTTSPCSPFEPARGAASRGDRGGRAPVPLGRVPPRVSPDVSGVGRPSSPSTWGIRDGGNNPGGSRSPRQSFRSKAFRK